MPNYVVCFDVDGTLVNREGVIHPEDVRLLRENEAALFLAATGRPLHAVRTAFARNGVIGAKEALPIPLISQNGTIVYQPGEEPLSESPFPSPTKGAIVEMAQQAPRISAYFFYPDRVEVLHPHPATESLLARFDLHIVPFDDTSREEPLTKGMFVAEEATALQPLAERFRAMELEVAFSLPTVLEINPPEINKGRVLTHLLDTLGASDVPMAVAGDGENDLPLFEHAHITFCPADSPEHIRTQADHIIDVEKTGILQPMLAALQDAADEGTSG